MRDRVVATLVRLARLATQHDALVMAGRSHNVAAQATTLGKRFASAAEELLVAYDRLDELIARYPLRGIKGPVGTAQDMLDLLDGDAAKLADLEDRVAGHLGFARVLDSVGQVYPRSLDYDVVTALVQTAAGPSSLATTIRLMAGLELVTEGFQPGQVGSSAMPHKMNTRSCERVNGLTVLLRGYASMVGELAGDQWNEGDVSCSVVRRVALPDAFFAADGLFETFLTVLDEFGVFPAVVDRELERYLPFLATTKVLMAAVRAGVGRETAHEVIKEHAVAVALAMRESGAEGNDLLRPARRRPAARALPRRPRRPGRRAADLHRRGCRPGRPGRRPGRSRRCSAPGGGRLRSRRDPVTVEVRASTYGDPDVVALVAEVQQEYVALYGSEDATPMAPEEFVAPEGTVVLAYVGGELAACGAFRRHDALDRGDQADVRPSGASRPGSRPGRARRPRGSSAGRGLHQHPARDRRAAARGDGVVRELGVHRGRAVRPLPVQPAQPQLREGPHSGMTRSVTLVLVDADGVLLGALPPYPVDVPYWQETSDVVAEAVRLYGVTVDVLRLLTAEHPVPHGGAVTYLAEVGPDAVPTTLPLAPVSGHVAALALDDEPLRAPYARLGGPAASLAWARSVVGPDHVATQQRTWNLSAIWRLDAPGSTVWLKQVPAFFAHEAAVLAWAQDAVAGDDAAAARRGR